MSGTETRWQETQDGCDEVVFRYFMDVEQKRAKRFGQPCLLLLVSPGGNLLDTQDGFLKLLRQNLRSSDIVGWYRQGSLAGAILTQIGSSVDWQLARTAVSDRLSRRLDQLPGSSRAKSSVRIRRLPSPEATAG